MKKTVAIIIAAIMLVTLMPASVLAEASDGSEVMKPAVAAETEAQEEIQEVAETSDSAESTDPAETSDPAEASNQVETMDPEAKANQEDMQDTEGTMRTFGTADPSETAKQGAKITVHFGCKENYDDAFAILNTVNSARKAKGLSLLTMDKELLTTAMKMAEEGVGLNVSLTPEWGDSRGLSSKYCDDLQLCGTNWQYSTAQEAANEFVKDSDYKTVSLNGSYKSVGVGCIKVDDWRFWVICFGTASADKAARTDYSNKTVNVKFQGDRNELKQNKVEIYTGLGINLVGEKGNLPLLIGNGSFVCHIDANDFIITSSNNRVLEIKGNQYRALAKGKTTVAIQSKSDPSFKANEEQYVYFEKHIKDCKPKLAKAKFTYTGKVIKPSVKISGLKKNRDYKVVYKNNKKVGTGTVTIYGCGDYYGKVVKTFTIGPKGTSLKSVKGKGNTLTVNWNRQTAKMSKSRITGYQIQLATNKAFTKDKKTIRVKGYKTVSKKIQRLKANKRYYVRVRTYKAGKSRAFYSNWSKVKVANTTKGKSAKKSKGKAGKKVTGSVKLSATYATLASGGSKKIALNKGKGKWSVKTGGAIKVTKKTSNYVIVKSVKAGTGTIYCSVGKRKLQCKVKVVNNSVGNPKEDLGNALVVGSTGEIAYEVSDDLSIEKTTYNTQRGTVTAKVVTDSDTGAPYLNIKVKALKPGQFKFTIVFRNGDGAKPTMTGELVFIKGFRGKAKVKKTAANYSKWRKSVVSSMASSGMSTWQIIDAVGTLISTGNYSNKGGATGMQLWYGGNGTCVSGALMMRDFMNDLGIKNKVHFAGNSGGATDIFGQSMMYMSNHKNTWVTIGGKTFELNPQPGMPWPSGVVAR